MVDFVMEPECMELIEGDDVSGRKPLITAAKQGELMAFRHDFLATNGYKEDHELLAKLWGTNSLHGKDENANTNHGRNGLSRELAII